MKAYQNWQIHAESAVKHNSTEKAEWGGFAGQLGPSHPAMLPFLQHIFALAGALINVYGYGD